MGIYSNVLHILGGAISHSLHGVSTILIILVLIPSTPARNRLSCTQVVGNIDDHIALKSTN